MIKKKNTRFIDILDTTSIVINIDMHLIPSYYELPF